MKKILILALSIAFFAACKKSNSPDTLQPVVTITSPAANQQFGAGATINIKATVFDNRQLRTVHLYVTNKNTNAEVLHQENQVNAQTYELDKSFVAGSATVYLIKIEVADQSGNTAKSELEVRAN